MNIKGTLITIVVVLVVVFGAWYLSSLYIKNLSSKTYVPQGTTSNIQDTTSSISSDLNQIPDDSSANKEMDTLNQNLQSF